MAGEAALRGWALSKVGFTMGLDKDIVVLFFVSRPLF
jgi:hypothetical protein